MAKMAAVPAWAQMAILSLSLTLFCNAWQFHYSYSLWDEGFMWYGTQQVTKGGIPIRDFMAYDPGRYYASAALMGLWGDNGLLSLRWAMSIFEAIVVFGGLWIIDASPRRHSLLYWLLAALTLVAWMVPYFKMHDFLACMLLLGALGHLAQKPGRIGYLLAGICVGLAAVFGRNHGLYGVVGSLGVMLWLAIRPGEGLGFVQGFSLWALGILVGFAPVLLMMFLTPGFAAALWESILFNYEYGSTPLAVPVPWPWRISVAAPWPETIRKIVIGLLFIATVVFALLSMAWVLTQRVRRRPVPPALVAAAFLALPYAHYAYSRADAVHLALGILPFLVGSLVITASQPSRIRWPLAFAICAGSVWIMFPFQIAWWCERNQKCVQTDISGESFVIDQQTAGDIGLLRKLAAKYAPDGRPFIAVPFWPGAYSLLERRSPLWEIYGLVPRSPAFEQAEIERLKAANPGFAVIANSGLDGRDDLTFQITHKLTHQYIVDHFDRVEDPTHPLYQIFKSRE